MLNGVLLQKFAALEEALGELRSLGQVSGESLARDWRTRRAVERDLQVLVEIVIDVCQRLIVLAGQAPAASGGEAVERCLALGALSAAEPYRRMVQFRNLVVHRYEKVEGANLAEIVNRHLEDFARFRDEVATYERRQGGRPGREAR